MHVSEAIRLKRAVRTFSNQPLTDDLVTAILDAGRHAQSSKNSQPWQFIAVTNKDQLKLLAGCGMNAGHLAGAALGVAIIHPDPFEKFQTMFDVGQAAAYMQLAAWESGIGSCLASIYDLDQARQVLGFPQDLFLRIAISFGYPQEQNILIDPPHKGGRKILNEIVHWDRW